MTPEKLAELERLARAATPGPWTTENNDIWQGTQVPELFCYIEGCVGKVDFYDKEDADYIAALNPQTCLELIESLRIAREDALREALYIVAEGCDGDLDFAAFKLKALIDKPSAKEGNL